MVLENSDLDEIKDTIDLCIQLNLPVTLKQLNITENIEEKIRKVAEAACAEGETIHNMPFKVTPDDVFAAILTADQLGQKYFAD